MEVIILLGSAIGLGVSRYIGKLVKYKTQKCKLRKKLYHCLNTKHENGVKCCIAKLKDFDKQNNTDKLNHYINKYIRKYGDKAGVNGGKLRLYVEGETEFYEIYEIIKEEDIVDIIQDQLDKATKVLSEVEQKRKEIILRKNRIRRDQELKSKKLNRVSGKMG